jgi:PhzF family phenazine biosynthesis protein
MNIPIYQVDAFTSQPFKGNPAAVCLLETDISNDIKLYIAAENNLSETAFLLKTGDGAYNLQWFTPTVEIELCGHATLASAHILWELGLENADTILHFKTLSGILKASKSDNWITLDFPEILITDDSIPEDLQNIFPNSPIFKAQSGRYIVELSSAKDVVDYQPDFNLLEKYATIITAKGDSNSSYDFVSRFFALPVGVKEDPVTGSAHCCLTPFWAKKLGKTELFAYQASARGGELKLKLENGRVFLSGEAITLIKGAFLLPTL